MTFKDYQSRADREIHEARRRRAGAWHSPPADMWILLFGTIAITGILVALLVALISGGCEADRATSAATDSTRAIAVSHDCPDWYDGTPPEFVWSRDGRHTSNGLSVYCDHAPGADCEYGPPTEREDEPPTDGAKVQRDGTTER